MVRVICRMTYPLIPDNARVNPLTVDKSPVPLPLKQSDCADFTKRRAFRASVAYRPGLYSREMTMVIQFNTFDECTK